MLLCEGLAQMLCADNKRISHSSRKYLSIINFQEYIGGEKRTFMCFHLVLGSIVSNSGFIILLGGVCLYLSMYDIAISVCLYMYLNGLFIERETHS